MTVARPTVKTLDAERENADWTRLRYAADLVFFRDEYLPAWPFIPLAAPLVVLAYLKLRRVL